MGLGTSNKRNSSGGSTASTLYGAPELPKMNAVDYSSIIQQSMKPKFGRNKTILGGGMLDLSRPTISTATEAATAIPPAGGGGAVPAPKTPEVQVPGGTQVQAIAAILKKRSPITLPVRKPAGTSQSISRLFLGLK